LIQLVIQDAPETLDGFCIEITL